MRTIRQVLSEKPSRELVYVRPSDTVFKVLKVLADFDIGAVLVMDCGQIVGIFSERDYARRLVVQGKNSMTTPVGEVMTDKVIYVSSTHLISDCMALMTEQRIRHLPVVDDGEIQGMVSIGDMVKATIADQQFEIDQLLHYIQNAPAGII